MLYLYVPSRRLAVALERKLGFGLIASVKLSTDQDSGRSKVKHGAQIINYNRERH